MTKNNAGPQMPQLTAMQQSSLKFWLRGLQGDTPSSSNQPSMQLPFQRWFKFKEAFAPSLVIDCLKTLDYKPKTCLDVFGGCGTSALTSQFLGIRPTLIEVNPFIADLAEAKLCDYEDAELDLAFKKVARSAKAASIDDPMAFLGEAPRTFCERKGTERWLYKEATLRRILAYRQSIESLDDAKIRRLLRVLLGSCLVPLSNVVVNGKGRKYRQSWQGRQAFPEDVDALMMQAFHLAVSDISVYRHRATKAFEIYRGSCLDQVRNVKPADVAIFSPPYPNSFDYTDIYNIELWVLGYLTTRQQDRALRSATLRSHVQVELEERGQRVKSRRLRTTIRKLEAARETLWDPRLPAMIDGYFSDLETLLVGLKEKIRPGGDIFLVVGDSSYSGVMVSVANILCDIAGAIGLEVVTSESVRKMRKSAQQGGSFTLGEHIVRLRTPRMN